MPDVIVWMISGTTRIAYHRIPAYDVLYSARSEDACGKHCGKLYTFFLKVRITVNSLFVCGVMCGCLGMIFGYDGVCFCVCVQVFNCEKRYLG